MNKILKYIGIGCVGVACAMLLVETTSLLIRPFIVWKTGVLSTKFVHNETPAPGPSGTPKENKRQISVLATDPTRTVYVIGEVGENALSVASQITRLGQESDKPIYVVLTSPGGSVLTGGQIIAAMEASKAPVYTVCNYLCASMAAMIFEYGTERYIGDKSFVMFHPASGSSEGELDKMVSRMLSMQRYIGKMESHAGDRAKLTFDQYKAKAQIEAWIDGEDAVATGFADHIATIYLPPDSPLSGPVGARVLYQAIFTRKDNSKRKIDYNWITPVEDLEWLR